MTTLYLLAAALLLLPDLFRWLRRRHDRRRDAAVRAACDRVAVSLKGRPIDQATLDACKLDGRLREADLFPKPRCFICGRPTEQVIRGFEQCENGHVTMLFHETTEAEREYFHQLRLTDHIPPLPADVAYARGAHIAELAHDDREACRTPFPLQWLTSGCNRATESWPPHPPPAVRCACGRVYPLLSKFCPGCGRIRERAAS